MKLLSKNNSSTSKGFTLIELLVVIAVLGVLAAGVFTAINPLKRIQQANDAKIKNDISQIAQAEQAYFTSSSSSGAPYYAREVSTLSGAGADLKVEPYQPGSTTPYVVTGATTAGAACTTALKNCAEVTVSAPLTEKDSSGVSIGSWCWESVSGKTGRVATAPGATATACGTFL